MQLLNVPVAVGGWVQVYDGTATATISVYGTHSPVVAQICQSTAAPSNSLIGLPLTSTSDSKSSYVASSGTPVYVKALVEGVSVIINA
ncbi:hypothetical protein HV032_15095 [Citrobacter freundii]|nr:hypothetical protein HV032_15095 [Citrobacter freundii]